MLHTSSSLSYTSRPLLCAQLCQQKNAVFTYVSQECGAAPPAKKCPLSACVECVLGPLAARLLWQCCRGTKGQPREPCARGDLHCQSPRSPLAPGVINSDQLCLCLNLDSHPKDKICILSEVCCSSPAMSAVHKDCSGTAELPDITHAEVQTFSWCECMDLHLHVLQLSVVLRLPGPRESFIS